MIFQEVINFFEVGVILRKKLDRQKPPSAILMALGGLTSKIKYQ